MPETKAIRFNAGNGSMLAGTLYTPARPTGSAVLVAGALAVHQTFYARFAQWLALRGHWVMTYDSSGMGDSLACTDGRSPRDVTADMISWARIDFAAAVGELRRITGQEKIGLVGHSLGTHHAMMTTPAVQQHIRRVVSVAAGAGYWRDWAAPSRRLAPLMLHLAIPLLTPAMGYFPGRRLRMVGDLPAGVALQWARWCRHPEFAWGCEPDQVNESLQSARFSVCAFSFSDDEAMTENCTRKLLAATPNTSNELRIVSPHDVGMDAIGHLGALRRDGEKSLWPLIEEALRGH